MGALQGRVALVTGSSSGIGEAVARRLADEGAAIVVNSASSVEAGEAIAASLPDAVYVQGDVSDPTDVARIVAGTDRWGRLDILVNNAGYTRKVDHADLAGADLQLWQRVFAVNVFGSWLMSQAAMPLLKTDGGGSIINMSSLAGSRETGSSLPYACSKAALDHQTRLLAKVVGPEVTVNAVAPGLIETPWTGDWKDLHEAVAAAAPLRRVGTPADVAEATYRLATIPYVTGQVLLVDGGTHLVI
ncbi:MAG: SDR family oxidoreductase [Actinomycetota bacterium]|nr:SDR family oxidoreductase [Actinomycetota bacterium]